MKKKDTKNKTFNKIKKVNKNQQSTKQFKQKYFDFYDDIKHYTNGKEDW